MTKCFYSADPEKLASALSKTIYEAHMRTCHLSRDQIQQLWSQGFDQQKLFLYKNMVSRTNGLTILER